MPVEFAGMITVGNVAAGSVVSSLAVLETMAAMAGSSLLRVLVDDSLNEKYYQLDLDFSGDGLPCISGQGFDLADGIAWCLADDERHMSLCQQAREQALATYGEAAVAQGYHDIYRRLLDKN